MALTDRLAAIANAIRSQSGKTAGMTLAQMPEEIMGLQPLNFEITGNPQPVQPKENTIWVDTGTEITGWIFSAAQPEGQEGLLWIKTAAFSSARFNALKKNTLTVYPLSARQYNSGTWEKVTAKIWQNGAWVEWIPENALYYHGDECVPVSGGWQARGWKNGSNYGEIIPIIVNRDDHMEITVPSGNVVSGAVEIKKDQDFTNISGITIDFEVELHDYLPFLMVIDRNATYMGSSVRVINVVGDRVNNGTFTRRTVTLDTSGLSGLYDIVIGFADAWAGTLTEGVHMKVYSVIMEHGELPPGDSGWLSITDDGEGNVIITSSGSVSITDDGNGNVVIA